MNLTPQERMVLRLYAELEREQLVADDMGLAPQTVKNILSKVYRKLDTTNRIGAFKAMGWLKLP